MQSACDRRSNAARRTDRQESLAFAAGYAASGRTGLPAKTTKVFAELLGGVHECIGIPKVLGLCRTVWIQHDELVVSGPPVAVNPDEAWRPSGAVEEPEHHRGISGRRPRSRQPPGSIGVQS